MNVLENHIKRCVDKYVKEITELCKTFFKEDLNETPTHDQMRAFTFGHFCCKNKINNIDDFYKAIEKKKNKK